MDCTLAASYIAIYVQSYSLVWFKFSPSVSKLNEGNSMVTAMIRTITTATTPPRIAILLSEFTRATNYRILQYWDPQELPNHIVT